MGKITKYGFILIYIIFQFSSIISISADSINNPKGSFDQLKVTIDLDPNSTIYEGDIIKCEIIGNPTKKYWCINNQSPHTSFYNDNPIIYDPEPTPLNCEYVNLTVYVENENSNYSDTVRVKIKRIYFGDIHFHSTLSDGYEKIDELYSNAIKDNYLDFVCLTDHGEWIDGYGYFIPYGPFWIRVLLNNFYHYLRYGKNDWEIIKQKAIEYYNPGYFTTLLGFEWSASKVYPGGYEDSKNGSSDTCHINFYYRDIYEDAKCYSAWDKEKDPLYGKPTFAEIFDAMNDEWEKGNYNIGFPHHPQFININWSYLANKVSNEKRANILRGVETYSTWGTGIGNIFTPDLPFNWRYPKFVKKYNNDSWVENALWLWSEDERKLEKFALIASSDTHGQNRPGSAIPAEKQKRHANNPSGLVAVYSVHNKREEIWDAMNSCDMYALQLLKMRLNVRFDGQIAIGRWVNCTNPLEIRITASSTFPGIDRSEKSMCPYGYSKDMLDFPIIDIYIIKKDNEKGMPWCKIINHTITNSDFPVVTFEDFDVAPNDFYYIAIRQKGDLLIPKIVRFLDKIFPNFALKWIEKNGKRDEYMAFIGPFFINEVTT